MYANKTATSALPDPLSASLEEFIKKDNVSFADDLRRMETEWSGYNTQDGSGNWMNNDVSKVMDDWDIDDPLVYNGEHNTNYDWNTVSAKKFHEQDSGVSSTTLTPNTEVDDGVGMVEMQEVNGGISAWADGNLSNASSDALGAGDPMEISEGTQPKTDTRATTDVEMSGVEPEEGKAETGSKVEHIEMVEKKGG